MDELIATKLGPPIWLGQQMRREKLLAQLGGVWAHRLTLIQAPAGYGKTSLLAQWRAALDTDRVEVAWLNLEREDRDINRFIAYLLVAMQVGEKRGEQASSATELPPRAALSAVINLLANKDKPFVLVLDDLHNAESEAVDHFLAALLRLAPANAHFVFASRDYPALGQSVLAAEEQVLEIGAQELRFSAEETLTMLSKADGSLAKTDVDEILRRTEGWPIAVQLTSLSLKRGIDRARFIERFTDARGDLARYLSEQVLVTLQDETREIVLRTVLPNKLSGEIVDLLCDRSDGWLVLERLAQQGVFLSSDQGESAYHYHQLFAEYLRERFMRADRAGYARLQVRLARFFSARGDITEAVHHAIMADDEALLADILEDAGGWRLIPQGVQGVLEAGLARLANATIRDRPRLALARIYLQLKCGELGAARSHYDGLLHRIAETDLPAELRTELRVVGDTLLDYENTPVKLDDLLERESLLRKLPADDHLVLANISETLAAKYFEGGWLERALQPALAARDHYQAFGSVYSDLFTRFLEARIKRAQGRLQDAQAILEAARRTIVENFGEKSDLAANCQAFLAELAFERNDPREARLLLDWALPHMECSDGWVDVYAAAYLTEARMMAGDGDFDGAWSVLDRARRTAARRRLRQLELLAEMCEYDLRISNGASRQEAEAAAARIELDRWADSMSEESPRYRPVAVAAFLNRAKLMLNSGRFAEASQQLAQLRQWANQRGAGRLLVDVNLLAACASRELGATKDARAYFDEAVGIAMFQDLVRPFIEMRKFVMPCLDDALQSERQVDRLRAQFLGNLSRQFVAIRNNVTVQGVFTEAEAEVLYHLSHGHSNKEIARLIGMSPDTVKYRLKAVFRKVGATKRSDAIRVAAERGLIPAASAVGTLQA